MHLSDAIDFENKSPSLVTDRQQVSVKDRQSQGTEFSHDDGDVFVQVRADVVHE